MISLPKEYQSPVLLGNGSNSTVYRVYQSKLDRMAALKIFRGIKKDVIDKMLYEAKMLDNASLDCVPHIYDIQYCKSGPMILMQWIRGVTVKQFCSVNNSTAFRAETVEKILHSMAQLHRVNIAHCDLKPENIILSSSGNAYLVDFGFASGSIRTAFSSDTTKGTPQFMAPELWSYERNIDMKRCDVYAMGVIMRQILGNEFPAELNSMTDANPQERPPDGMTVLSIWEKIRPRAENLSAWTDAVENATLIFVVSKLTDAAKLLLDQKRKSEAYQIVTEILEESPDNAFALSMLQSSMFVRNDRKKNSVLLLLSIIALSAVIFSAAFELGRKADQNITIQLKTVEKINDGDTLLEIAEPDTVKRSPAEFRNIYDAAKLDCEVVCYVPASEGVLEVDEKKVAIKREDGICVALCRLPQGMHKFQWTDSTRDMTFVEKLNLLPFEERKFSIGFNN